MKKILILTAGFGEGHNSAARGLCDALAQSFSQEAEVELHDLFAEAYGMANDWARKAYMTLINRTPHTWGAVYGWLDRKSEFSGNMKLLYALKNHLSRLLARFRPDVVVSVYPAYAHLLDDILGLESSASCRRVVVITDSITVNAIWYRCRADYFLVPNEATAAVLRENGVTSEKIKIFGFPVSPKFAQPAEARLPPNEESGRRVLYMINAGKSLAPELVRRLCALPEIKLTVTVAQDQVLRVAMEQVRTTTGRNFEIVGWSTDLPRMLRASHLLISKAGGATVQETIAASCPMIINQVIPGQEEGNARLIVETNSGVVATSPHHVVAEVQRAFANGAQQWRQWEANISKLSRPNASIESARFLVSLN